MAGGEKITMRRFREELTRAHKKHKDDEEDGMTLATFVKHMSIAHTPPHGAPILELEDFARQHKLEDWATLQRQRKWDFAGKVARLPEERWCLRLLSWRP